MNYNNLTQDWMNNKITTTDLIKEIETLRGLLVEAHDVMDDVHLYDTDLYNAISEHLYKED